MANEFDPYREALVVECATLWPPDRYDLTAEQQSALESALHCQPQLAQELTYVRLPTGFCRQIRVMPEDLARLGVTVQAPQEAGATPQNQDLPRHG